MKGKNGYLLALLCLIYFAVVCLATGRLGGAQLLWVGLAAVFAGYTWLRRRVNGAGAEERKEMPWRRRRLLLRICTVCLVLALAGGGICEGRILSAMAGEPDPDADYVIVLGAKVNGTRPSLTLRYRIDSAADYLREHSESKAVASGGQGNDEGISEGAAIAAGLVERGIDASRIMIEDKSTSTEENLRFSLALIESDGGSEQSPVVIVTSDFHLFRGMRLAKRTGFESVSGCAARSMGALVPQNHLREVLAVGFYSLRGDL